MVLEVVVRFPGFFVCGGLSIFFVLVEVLDLIMLVMMVFDFGVVSFSDVIVGFDDGCGSFSDVINGLDDDDVTFFVRFRALSARHTPTSPEKACVGGDS